MLADLRTGPDDHLYAVQIGLFTEEGPVPNSGAIIRVKAGDASEKEKVEAPPTGQIKEVTFYRRHPYHSGDQQQRWGTRNECSPVGTGSFS